MRRNAPRTHAVPVYRVLTSARLRVTATVATLLATAAVSMTNPTAAGGAETITNTAFTPTSAFAPGLLTGTSTTPVVPPADANERPNIILVVADDQTDYETDAMRFTKKLFAEPGTVVTDFISPHPVCCPARAELMTGEYAQNNGVHYNSGAYGGYRAFVDAGNNTDNIGTWLTDSGYQTAFVGKMLNSYSPERGAMPGWTHWNPSITNTYGYYDTEFYNDGDPEVREEYVADAVADYATEYINEFAANEEPFFMWLSHVGPHGASEAGQKDWEPPIPAERHVGRFAGTTSPSKAKRSFGEPAMDDKPRYVRGQFGGANRRLDRIDFLYQRRLESLQGIDEANRSLIMALRRTGELDNTIIIYTSDNGFLLGEHRVIQKNLPYEEALQVPLIIRGPGIPVGAVVDQQTITMVDIPTTILAAGGILDQLRAGGRTDGIDMRPILSGTESMNSTQLIQSGDRESVIGDAPWLFRGVRTHRYTYAAYYDGDLELYDRWYDSEQIKNVASRADYAGVLAEMQRRTAALIDCDGHQECRYQNFGADPQPTGSAGRRDPSKKMQVSSRW